MAEDGWTSSYSQAERERDRERENASLLLPCSIQALNRLDDAHPHCGGPSAFLRPSPIQMLISSETPSQTHPEICFI